MTTGQIATRIRGASEAEQDLRQGQYGEAAQNARGDLLLAQALSPCAEVARQGQTYRACQTAAVNSVTALPTTAAQVTLWNGEPDTGLSYVVHSVATVVQASSFGGAASLGLVGCLNRGKKADPAGTLLTIRGTAGQAYRGRGKVSLARSITNDGWFPLGSSGSGGAFSLAGFDMTGVTAQWFAHGVIVLLPSHMFSISVVSEPGAGLMTVRSAIRWMEVRL